MLDRTEKCRHNYGDSDRLPSRGINDVDESAFGIGVSFGLFDGRLTLLTFFREIHDVSRNRWPDALPQRLDRVRINRWETACEFDSHTSSLFITAVSIVEPSMGAS